MKVSKKHVGDAPRELKVLTREVKVLHDRRDDPTTICKNECQEQVRMNLVSQTSHFPGISFVSLVSTL